jgi:hypothetical protein
MEFLVRKAGKQFRPVQRRDAKIPADQGARGGVKGFHRPALWTTGDAGVAAIAGAIRLVRVRVIVNWTTSKPSASENVVVVNRSTALSAPRVFTLRV